jgi:2-oxoglutarate ferredoxin oxidoreductase subunit gamma
MNLPSLVKFENIVKPGGQLFVNTSLIKEKPSRNDVEVIDIDATGLLWA